MKKLIICLLLLIVLLFAVACSDSEGQTKGPIAAIEDEESDSRFDSLENKPEDVLISLMTEDFPPLNYVKDDKILGPSFEIVNQIAGMLDYKTEITVMPWQRGYLLTETNPNTGLFSTVRNEAREDLFKWVGPIAKKTYTFYARKDSGIVIKSIEDAKKYTVGGQKGGFTGDFLIDNGFESIKYDVEPYDGLSKLYSGSIDLWYTSIPTFEQLIRESKTRNDEEFDRDEFIDVYQTVTAKFYIAFNKETPDDIIASFQEALDELSDEGKIEEIFANYELNELSPMK